MLSFPAPDPSLFPVQERGFHQPCTRQSAALPIPLFTTLALLSNQSKPLASANSSTFQPQLAVDQYNKAEGLIPISFLIPEPFILQHHLPRLDSARPGSTKLASDQLSLRRWHQRCRGSADRASQAPWRPRIQCTTSSVPTLWASRMRLGMFTRQKWCRRHRSSGIS